MKIINGVIFILCLLTVLSGCGVMHNSSKYNFVNGYYFSRLDTKKVKRYYVVTGEDSIKVYPSSIGVQLADTVKSITVLFPPNKSPQYFLTILRRRKPN